jgi:predicted metal-dependent hydrolase
MTTEARRIVVGGVLVDVVRKPIKNLHLGVYPPAGRVRVAAPLTVSDDAVRLAVVTRLAWIKRQKQKFEDQARQSVRTYVTGESHYVFGRRYRLRLIERPGRAEVVIRGASTIDLCVRPGTDVAAREQTFLDWRRSELRTIATDIVKKRAGAMGLPTPELGIKRMKTKWGVCNAEAGRIWLNLELSKKPVACIEYIVVHELAHFLERNHNDRFVALMDAAMPTWRARRDELNASPLGDEVWEHG